MNYMLHVQKSYLGYSIYLCGNFHLTHDVWFARNCICIHQGGSTDSWVCLLFFLNKVLSLAVSQLKNSVESCIFSCTFRLYYKTLFQSLFIYVVFNLSCIHLINFHGYKKGQFQIPQQSVQADLYNVYSFVLADLAQPLNPIQWGSSFSLTLWFRQAYCWNQFVKS